VQIGLTNTELTKEFWDEYFKTGTVRKRGTESWNGEGILDFEWRGLMKALAGDDVTNFFLNDILLIC
jgi:hypothetical protein